MIVASDKAARELLEVIPVIMKDIRSEMRSRRPHDLTVPQFRTLAFVDRNEGASLSAVANHMGLTLPSTSRLVDGLIARGMLTREDNPADRRRLKLGVTNHGLTILETSRRGTLTYLANKIASLSAEDREVIAKAMKAMRSVFISGTQTQAVVK
jgi:MarR family transcriptional regulator for hemolysin